MALRAIFSFRNPDRTKDLNDRFTKLFSKGFFDGGEITPVPSNLEIDVAAFKAISEDGMVVVDTDVTRLTVLAGAINYVVLRAVYSENQPPTLSWEVLEQVDYDVDPQQDNLIVRAVIVLGGAATEVNAGDIDETTADFVDNLGRGSFRGVKDAVGSLPGDQNRVGDTHVVTTGGGDTPEIYVFNGSVHVNVTQAAAISTTLTLHRQNLFSNEIHATDDQADAFIGTSGTPPSFTNPYVDDADTRLLSQDENDAAAGFPNSVDDARILAPSDTNRYVTGSAHRGVGEEKVFASAVGTSFEITPADGPIYVGKEVSTNTALKYFNLFNEDPNVDQEYVNTEGKVPKVDGVFKDAGLTAPILPSVDTVPGGEPDPSGFFTSSLFIRVTEEIDSGFIASYIKQYTEATQPPDAYARRKPSDAQVDSRVGVTTAIQRFLVTASTQEIFNLDSLQFEVLASNGARDSEVYENGVKLFHDNDSFVPITISAGVNDTLDFIDSNLSLEVATLTPATYSTKLDLVNLATDIENKLNAETTDTFTVTFNAPTFTFTLQNNTGPWDLLFNSGVNFSTSAHPLIGFDDTDKTGLLLYDSDEQIDRGSISWTKVSSTQIRLFRPAKQNAIIEVLKYINL